MKPEEFKKILEDNKYSFFEKDGRIIINHKGDLWKLRYLTSIPEKVTFRNLGHVDFRYITKLPPETIFSNQGHVSLESLKPGSFSKGVRFKQKTKAYFDFKSDLYGVRSGFPIKGINTNRILNSLIETIFG